MRKFKIGDEVVVTKIESVDEEIIDVGVKYKIIGLDTDENDESYMYVLDLNTNQGFGDWIVYEWQIELVEEEKKPFRVGPPKTNYVQDTIELLEEDLLEAKHKLQEHYEAVEKAEWLLENKEWIEHDHKDLAHSIQDAIDALRKV